MVSQKQPDSAPENAPVAKKNSLAASLTGLSLIRDGASSFVSNTKGSVDRTVAIGKVAFGKDTGGVAVEDDIDDKFERFERAAVLNNRTNRDIERSIQNTYFQSILFACIVLFNACVSIWKIATHGPFSFDFVFTMMPLPVLSALLFRAAYTNWMFRKRYLGGIIDFVRSGDVMPKMRSETMRRSTVNGRIVAALLFLGVLCIFHPTPSFAQNATNSTTTGDQAQQIFQNPSSNDIFVRMMAIVIPDVGPVGTSEFGPNSSQSATKAGFVYFSGALLFIGSMMTGWQILTSLVQSAKEGTALGRNYHEIWAPMRIVIGYGMLTPVLGGICAAQVLVLYLIVWGGNLANLIWVPYVQSVTEASTATNPANSAFVQAAATPIATDMVKKMYEKELCLQIINLERQKLGATAAGTLSETPTAMQYTSDQSALGQVTYDTFNYGPYCGTLQMAVTNPKGSSVTSYFTFSTTEEMQLANTLGTASASAMQAVDANMVSDASQAAQTYISNNGSPAAFSENGTTETPSTFRQYIQQYSSALATASAQASAQVDPGGSGQALLKQVETMSAQQGWASAGAFYLTVSRLQNAMFTGFTQAPTVTGIQPTNEVGSDTTKVLIGTASQPGALKQFETWFDTNIGTISPADNAEALKVSPSSSSFQILAPYFNAVSIYGVGLFAPPNINPYTAMQEMINYGNSLMIAGSTAYFATLAAAGVADGAGSLTGVGGIVKAFGGYAFKELMTVAGTLAFALIAAGALHAYVLPMMPYIMTIFFVVGMLFLVVESLVAAPIWAFCHIRMDGQEFVDSVQRPGYMIAFNLILRPALMIFGLILSYMVFGAVEWLVSVTFMPAVNGLSGSNTIGPIGMVVLILMVSYVDYQVAVRSFHLITHVPDRVTRWFGQGGENLGEEQHSREAIAFMAGRVEQNIGTMGGNALNNAKSRQASKRPPAKPQGGTDPSSNENGNNERSEPTPQK